MTMATKPERDESLWWLALAPAIWLLHFVATYITVAVWCARAASRDDALGPARIAGFGFTLAAFVALGALSAVAWRRRAVKKEPPQVAPGDDSSRARHGFLGHAVFLLSALSALGVAYVGSALVVFGSCR